MGRAIGGVIVGYLVMFVIVFSTFSVAFLAMGTDGAFQPGSYEVSMLWIVISIILGIAAAVAGGYVCALIARGAAPVKWLAGLVVILGILSAIPALMPPDPSLPTARDAALGNMEAMMNARTPAWIALLNPVIGAIGVMMGGRLRQAS